MCFFKKFGSLLNAAKRRVAGPRGGARGFASGIEMPGHGRAVDCGQSADRPSYFSTVAIRIPRGLSTVATTHTYARKFKTSYTTYLLLRHD